MKKWRLIQLPPVNYRDAWKLQTDLVAARWDRRLDTDVILMLEHPPVFTLGRRGGMGNLTVPESVLKERGIQVIQVERGGDITFHGPGQLVVYPIIDLVSARLGVADYVGMLEEVIIQVAADWGITAGRNPLNRGVWVGNSKLASIGIAVRRGVSFHGVALNVDLALEPFDWIHPCGLRGIGMTSLKKELGESVPMDDVATAVHRRLEVVFGIKLIRTKLDAREMHPAARVEDALLQRKVTSG